MILAEIYNPTISGTSYSGFLKALNTFNPLGSTAKWFSHINADELDNYIYYNLSQRELFDYLATDDLSKTYNFIHSILVANEYKLNGLYDSTTYSDKYSPIENYDRIEDMTTSTSADNGKRKATSNFGAYTNKDTSSATTSPFDASDYSAPTDKNESIYENSAHTDTSESDASHDESETITSGRIHGNIGVATASDLLGGHRAIVNYVFFDELIKIICNTMLKSCLWNV